MVLGVRAVTLQLNTDWGILFLNESIYNSIFSFGIQKKLQVGEAVNETIDIDYGWRIGEFIPDPSNLIYHRYKTMKF